ncbi:MAG: hypothetical protein VKL39_12035 [Leptolyngbyaceae bacterium]|nr:hypothetical protein [Leptolyngbyaceae bacterium]
MTDSALYLDSLPVRCRVYGLSAMQSDSNGHEEVERILVGDRPFRVQLTLDFLGNSAIALLMLEPMLFVEVLVKPAGMGDKVELGAIHQTLTPEQLTYAPVLDLESPIHYGLDAGLYHLSAMVRIGAENGPALLCGSVKGPTIEVFSPSPPQTKQKSTKRRR